MGNADGNRILTTGSVIFENEVSIDVKVGIELAFRRADTGGRGGKSVTEDGNPVILFDIGAGEEISARVKFEDRGTTYRISYRLTCRQVSELVFTEAVYTVSVVR